MNSSENGNVTALLKELSSKLDGRNSSAAIILAAGHGKRIKSERSKMMHEIWGIPTVVRVANAAVRGLQSENQVIVVGIKARQVAEAAGRAERRVFVLQREQRGTGDATREALRVMENVKQIENLYIFPGDMGLITPAVVKKLKNNFDKSDYGMIILTGKYRGEPEQNTYGRIIRVPKYDRRGEPAGDDEGKVIEIKEHKDILSLSGDIPYETQYNGRKYNFTKTQLLNISEYNTAIYAVKYPYLKKHINDIKADNVQGELYLTDIISIFNRNGICVGAYPVDDSNAVIGFNVKSVLKEMERIYREKVYLKLRDIILIEDEDDFFIADEVVDQIMKLDKTYPSLDIELGKGVHISKGVTLNRGVVIRSGASLKGNIEIGEGTEIQENVTISTYPHQQMRIGKECLIMRGDIIKGNLSIGDHTRIESSVNMTGSDQFPTVVGNSVTIKGTTYIFGSMIEDDLFIEHSVLKCKKVERTVKKDGSIQPIRWVMPQPQGLDIITNV